MAPSPSPGRFRFSRTVLAGSMLVMGACGISYEYALGVLGNNLMGSSHEQILVIIGIMMFAMGLGAALQRHLVGDLLDRFLALELALGVVGGVSGLVIYVAYVHMTGYLVVMYAFAVAIGLAIGLEIPLLIRLNADYAATLRGNLSDILCMDYVGSLIGALVFTYVMLSHLSLGRIPLVVGLVNTALAVVGLAYFWPLVRRRRTLAAATAAAFGLLAVSLARADRWTAALEQRTFEDPIVHSQTTRYQHLVLTRRGDHTRLYINGHLQFSSKDEVVYHELLAHVPMAAAARRDRVLILGGGDGLALREVLAYPDVAAVTLVDIDPAMVRLATEHPELVRLNHAAFSDARVRAEPAAGIGAGDRIVVERPSHLARGLLDDTVYRLAEVEVVTVDADRFVRAVDQTYDVMLLDFPDPKTVEIAKLYSVDFYRALARRLAPGGTVAVQSTSPMRAKQVFLCIGETLRQAGFRVLPYHDWLESFGDWGFYLAWRGGPDPDELLDRIAGLAEFAVETRYLTVEKMRAAFVFGRGRLTTPGAVAANTKLRPSLIEYYRQSFR